MRSVETEAENVTIDAIAQVSPGNDITVSVDATTTDAQCDIELQHHEREVACPETPGPATRLHTDNQDHRPQTGI